MKTKPPKIPDHTTETMPPEVARAIGRHATITAGKSEEGEDVINIFIQGAHMQHDQHFQIRVNSPASMVSRLRDIWDYLGK